MTRKYGVYGGEGSSSIFDDDDFISGKTKGKRVKRKKNRRGTKNGFF